MGNLYLKIASMTILMAACSILQAAQPDTLTAPVTVAATTPMDQAPIQCAADPALSSLQRRLLDRYDRDIGSLVRYVWISRAVLQLDIRETALWAEAYRAAHPAC
jgi:hypothetical protein